MYYYYKSIYQIIFFFIASCNILWANQIIPETIKKVEDSLLYEISRTTNDSVKVEIFYDLSYTIFRYDLLKGLKYIESSIKIAEENDELSGVIWGYYLQGNILQAIGDYEKSIEAIFKAELLNKDLKSDKLYSRIYNTLGNFYAANNDYEKSVFYLKLSNEYSTKIGDSIGVSNALNDFGYALIDWGKYDSALYYLERASGFCSSNDYHSLANIYLNIMNVYFNKEQGHDKIYLILQKLMDLEDKITDLLIMGELYYFYGRYYRLINDEAKSVSYLERSVDLCKTSKYWSMMSLAARELVDISIDEGNSYHAFKYRELDLLAKDSLNIDELRTNIAKIEFKKKYDNHLSQMQIEKQRSKFNRLLLGIFIFFSSLILGIFYYLKRREAIKRKHDSEIKQKLYEVELKNSSLEQIKLRNELKFKNNELMNFALQIVQKNDFVKNVLQKIKKLKMNLIKEENIKKIDAITLFINQSLDINKARKEFYMNIDMLNKTFFQNLTYKFPDLTDNEKRLALLLRLDFSSKQIATLLDVSIHTVESGRYRLRKKLNIYTRTNLSEYFNYI